MRINAFHTGKGVAVKFLLLLGMIVSVLSISIMYGMAAGEEEVCMSYNLFTALVVNPENVNYSDEMIELIKEKSNREIENLICITQIGEKAFVVGWDGYSPTRWFAHTSGRFFSEEEEANGSNVAYISESVFRNKTCPDKIVLGEQEYSVIGVGGIVEPSFQNVVPDESEVQLVPGSDEPMDYSNPYTWIVIPYEKYKQYYVPDQILVHYLGITSKELKENKSELEKALDEAQVLMPKYSMDEESRKVLREYNGLAVFVLGMAMTSMMQLVKEWILTEKESLYIYHLCGMSKRRCVFRMIMKMASIYTLGMMLGYGIYYEMIPVLQRMCEIGAMEITRVAWISLGIFTVLEVETGIMTWNPSNSR